MILFFVSVILLVLFFLVLSVFAIQSRSFTLFTGNLIGVVAAVLSFALEFTASQTKLSLAILLGVILVVIVVDFIHLIAQVLQERRSGSVEIALWEKKRGERLYRMVFHEELFLADLERHQDSGMTENMQAFQMWRMGNQAFLQDDLEDALEKYDLSLKWQPTSVAWINKSGIFFERSDYPGVVKCCEEAIALNPDRKEAWINRGLSFDALDELNKSLKSFEEALVADQSDPQVYTLLANTLRRQGQLDAALEKYDQAIHLSPDFMEAWFQKGLTLSLAGKLDEAVESFRQVLLLRPRHPLGHYHLANALNKLNRSQSAILHYRKALKYDPKMLEAWNNLGIAQSKVGRVKESLKSYQKAIELNPDYHEAWLNQALASETLKKYKNAVAGYRRFLELAPENLVKHRSIALKHLEEIEKRALNMGKETKKKRSPTPGEDNDSVQEEGASSGTVESAEKNQDPEENTTAAIEGTS